MPALPGALLKLQPTGSEARLLAIGYLLLIKAHGLVEVMAAAASHGGSSTVGQSRDHRTDPLEEDDLRAHGGSMPAGEKGERFPDEAPLSGPVG